MFKNGTFGVKLVFLSYFRRIHGFASSGYNLDCLEL